MEEVEKKITNNEKGTPLFENDLDTASRWKRLWASLIDGLIMMLIVMPVMYLTGGFDGVSEGIQPSFGYSLMLGLFGIAVFIVINGKLLSKNGQTIGKRILGIKIVTLSGELPGIKKHLLKRYGVYFLLGQIPIMGQILSLINVLIIFGKPRRCGHDFVAGTAVVNR